MFVGPNSSEDLFLEVFEKYKVDLRAYARSMLPDWQAVDEALQEASIVMWAKFSQLNSVENFLPWAKTILRFEALKLRRSFARDRHVFSDHLFELLAAEDEEKQVESEQQAMEKCLHEISTVNQKLLLAPYSKNQAVIDIATKSGRTVNSLYKLMGRLRMKLRKCIEQRLKASFKESP